MAAVAKQQQAEPEDRTIGQIVDVPYALWLVTLACALMATIALAVTTSIYLLDATLSFSGGAPIFGNQTYTRVLELAALFGVAGVVAHLLRLRLEALRRASILMPLPQRIVTTTPSGDMFSTFECSCKVTLALDNERPLIRLKQNPELLQSYLENAFSVAVNDPVIRYSKAKMEQTMRIAALHVLGEGVAGVLLSEVRQRRVPTRRPANAANLDTPEPAAVG